MLLDVVLDLLGSAFFGGLEILHDWALRFEVVEVFRYWAFSFAGTLGVGCGSRRGEVQAGLHSLLHLLDVLAPAHEVVELDVFCASVSLFLALVLLDLLDEVVGGDDLFGADLEFEGGFHLYQVAFG